MTVSIASSMTLPIKKNPFLRCKRWGIHHLTLLILPTAVEATQTSWSPKSLSSKLGTMTLNQSILIPKSQNNKAIKLHERMRKYPLLTIKPLLQLRSKKATTRTLEAQRTRIELNFFLTKWEVQSLTHLYSNPLGWPSLNRLLTQCRRGRQDHRTNSNRLLNISNRGKV